MTKVVEVSEGLGPSLRGRRMGVGVRVWVDRPVGRGEGRDGDYTGSRSVRKGVLE